MKISIIIVSWNVKELLKQCLESIYLQTKKIQYEVFVVDNASNDNIGQMIKLNFPKVTFIQNETNKGFAFACNQAIKQAKGEYVLLLNPDTIIINNAIDKIYKFMTDHKDADIAGCKLLNPDYSLQSSVRHFPTLYSGLIQLLKIHHLLPPSIILKKYLFIDFNYNKTQVVDQVMGAFFVYKKQLGLLDENYYIWFEEVDMCKRAKKVYYVSDVQIIHYGGSSFKQVKTKIKQKYFYRSLLYYFKKFGLW